MCYQKPVARCGDLEALFCFIIGLGSCFFTEDILVMETKNLISLSLWLVKPQMSVTPDVASYVLIPSHQPEGGRPCRPPPACQQSSKTCHLNASPSSVMWSDLAFGACGSRQTTHTCGTRPSKCRPGEAWHGPWFRGLFFFFVCV